ncbi:MAG: SRPBCC domain-containing protein [Candidatus Abawacabacteria bacterium]|nr:SRPBCC domain-containing protein [Candidatus Abawacabacteria bacterium]
MKTLEFSVTINAPKEKVWHTMLAPDSYKVWTEPFMPGSYYEGSWDKGTKIKFLGPEKSGMIAEIAESKPYEFISIRHLGFIQDGVEDTESEAVKAWAPALENYTFTEQNGVTKVKVEMQVTADFEKDMVAAWPKALEKLKELCE